MNKTVQVILLTVVISLGISARLLLLGWLAIIGLASIFIFGCMHFLIHYYSMNSIAKNWGSNMVLALLSHYLFLNLFFFQADGGDEGAHVVIEYVLDARNSIMSAYSEPIFWISLLLYIIVAVMLIASARKQKRAKINYPFMAGNMFVVVLLSMFMVFSFDYFKEKKFEIQKEAPLPGLKQ